MTKLPERAFAEVTKLSTKEQNLFAKWVLAEIAAEQRWDETFRRSGPELSKLAEEAINEHRRGKTRPLDPDGL